MKQRAVKFTDEQWQIVGKLAAAANQTVGEWIRAACEAQALGAGHEWPASVEWGQGAKGSVNPHTTLGPETRRLQGIVDQLGIAANVGKARGGERNHIGYCLVREGGTEWLGESFMRAANVLRERYGEWS